jgi:hypothetical protein
MPTSEYSPKFDVETKASKKYYRPSRLLEPPASTKKTNLNEDILELM